MVLDLQFRPLPPVRTCRHLAVGQHDPDTLAFYPRCAIGDDAARERLGRDISEARLALMRSVVERVDVLIRAHLEPLAAAKAVELGAADNGGREQARAAMRVASADFERDASQLVRGDLHFDLNRLGVDVEAVMGLIRAGIEDYVAHGFDSWGIPDELLAAFPADVARFLKAEYRS